MKRGVQGGLSRPTELECSLRNVGGLLLLVPSRVLTSLSCVSHPKGSRFCDTDQIDFDYPNYLYLCSRRAMLRSNPAPRPTDAYAHAVITTARRTV